MPTEPTVAPLPNAVPLDLSYRDTVQRLRSRVSFCIIHPISDITLSDFLRTLARSCIILYHDPNKRAAAWPRSR